MFSKGSVSRKIFFGSLGTGFFLFAGAGIVYQRRLKENRSITAIDFNAKQDQNELEAALKNLRAKNKNDRPIVRLYRYTTCPWCGTVKAFLDVYKIEHELVEVEPMFKSQLAYIEYKKVPQVQFLMTGHWGPFVVDSDLIIRRLAKYVGDNKIEKQLEDHEIIKWRSWARDELVRFLVLNINKTLVDAWKGYDYIDSFETIPYLNKLFLKVMGAPVMYMVAQYMTKPSLIKNGKMNEGDDVREKLLSNINLFVDSGLKPKKSPFHGGKTPDLVDIDAYGVLQSIRGHMIYNDIISNTEIGSWLNSMDKFLGKEEYIVPVGEN